MQQRGKFTNARMYGAEWGSFAGVRQIAHETFLGINRPDNLL
jgi:hypothetical protein